LAQERRRSNGRSAQLVGIAGEWFFEQGDLHDAARLRYGWTIGRFVAMPGHLRFFCVSNETPKASSLSRFMAGFKQWTAKGILRATGAPPPFWQKEFFDHVLGSDESYESKWRYVEDNPVRAGLVSRADDWPYAGEIAPIIR
jgi:putative transposase